MGPNKSLDHKLVITALIGDVAKQHTNVSEKELRLDATKASERVVKEGMSFLTRTLPTIGKALDRALAGGQPLLATEHGFKPVSAEIKYPKFLGTLFKNVLDPNGNPLNAPCVDSVRSLRQILYTYYKYEIPYDPQLERDVIAKFERTELDIRTHNQTLAAIANRMDSTGVRAEEVLPPFAAKLVKDARRLLWEVLGRLNPRDIRPRHGPGAVSTRERHSKKYMFSQVPSRVTEYWPLDAYFYASLGHVCDEIQSLQAIDDGESPAKVILVPKDSRGPRLISCEPLSLQWIQQGLMELIVQRVESCALVRYNVSFTDQARNQRGAILGSLRGKYATLDLEEASDRVTVGLVRLLIPEPLRGAILASRSLSTQLPSGQVITLEKFAPMGSALCFPIMALIIWALLTAVADEDVRESILVYGDDVVVPTTYVGHAIERLEAFGLKINRAKSCTSGLFRESCGMDALSGANVTPVRFRTVWSPSPCPSSYVSWIAYANSCYERRYFDTYDYIVSCLGTLYKVLRQDEKPRFAAVPSLYEVPEQYKPRVSRINQNLQKRQWKVRGVRSVKRREEIPGWNKLLRFFAEANRRSPIVFNTTNSRCQELGAIQSPFSASEYTERRTKFVWRWQ
jgi:hypothetical protein